MRSNTKLTIIGNLRINSLTRLQHFKSSFFSFNTVSDNWLINIRGTFRKEAIDFLQEQLGDSLVLFELLDDSRGWISNSLEMLEKAKHPYILVWNEDHMNVAPQEEITSVVYEMSEQGADYLTYSWWMLGKARKVFDDLSKKIDFKIKKHISVVDLTSEKWRMVRETGYSYFIISMCGIFQRDFLKKMWMNDQQRLPLFYKKYIFKILGLLTKLKIISPIGHKELFEKINRIVFSNQLQKYPIVTPFEMEKGPERFDVFPFRMAISNQELFACIDDNVNVAGYSLVERGMYKVSGTVPIQKHLESIFSEMKSVLSRVDEKQVNQLVNHILSARKIIGSGAGRVGMAVRGFIMRLKHMGFDAYILGDANVPSIKSEDLFLVCSGSGETQTIYELTLIAKKNESQVALITGNPDSRIGKLAHSIVEIKAPSKTKQVEGFVSIQPMTTLNEQSLSIFFDALVLRLMDELGETHDTMWARHSNLE